MCLPPGSTSETSEQCPELILQLCLRKLDEASWLPRRLQDIIVQSRGMRPSQNSCPDTVVNALKLVAVRYGTVCLTKIASVKTYYLTKP